MIEKKVLENYVDATAAVLSLPLSGYRDGVIQYFSLAADFAAVVNSVDIPTHTESSNLFIPVTSLGAITDYDEAAQ